MFNCCNLFIQGYPYKYALLTPLLTKRMEMGQFQDKITLQGKDLYKVLSLNNVDEK